MRQATLPGPPWVEPRGSWRAGPTPATESTICCGGLALALLVPRSSTIDKIFATIRRMHIRRRLPQLGGKVMWPQVVETLSRDPGILLGAILGTLGILAG